VKHEYPLSSHVVFELENLLEVLGLRREDVDAIEQAIIAKQSVAVKPSRTEPPKVDPQYRKENTSQSQHNSRVKELEVSEAQDSSVMRYAGFWRRGIAFIVDAFISYGVWRLISVNIYSISKDLTTTYTSGNMAIFIYYILFEISPLRATIGKLITGLQVTDIYGNKIGFFRSLVRFIIKTVSIAFFGIGIIYLVYSFFSSKKNQGIHDFIAKTVVVRKEKRT
jgi:uncharacterized RDD family membrane protein YckC